jgi:hypothetical protein
MSRGGITFQPILFDLGAVTPLSPVVPPPAGGGTGGSGGGGVLAPILAGLLLFLTALGLPTGAIVPAQQGVSAPAPGAAGIASNAGSPAQAPGGPAPSAASPPAPPSPTIVPGPGPSQNPALSSTVPAPSRVPIVSPYAPTQGPSSPGAQRHGPPTISLGQRPVLPFTGASLLTPMAAGMGLIVLGLALRWKGDPSRRT